ncbi:MAG: hypothetical protein L0H79_13320, partial [Intrasporangium sp.]|nr:hypothetical protein [Intrasporangium sp.]
DALAHAAWLAGHRGDLLAVTDARRKEVYAAHYLLDDTGAMRVAGPLVEKAESLPEAWRTMPVVGRGPLLYPDAFATTPDPAPSATFGSAPRTAPRFEAISDSRRSMNTSNQLLDVPAGALADLAVRRLAAAADFDGLEPLYLRRPDVAPAAPAKSTLG